jgi:hypothetical protein
MADLILTKLNSDDGTEFHVDEATGICYASMSATARMCNCDVTQVRRVVGGDTETLEAALVKGQGGDRVAKLLTSSQVFDVALRYNTALAKAMGNAGSNVYLLGMAGYQLTVQTAQPKTALELAKEQVKLLEQMELQAAQIKILEDDNIRQAEVIDELFEYSSIIRVAKYNKCSEKAFSWHKLKAASKVLGEEIKKAPDPRYGEKNLYPHNAWRLAYPEYKLPETTTLTIG